MLIKTCNFKYLFKNFKVYESCIKNQELLYYIYNFAGEEKRKEEFYNSRGFETQKKGQVLGMHSYRILNIFMENCPKWK